MIKYRPHRGGLNESMAEAQEFDTEAEMIRHICDHYYAIYDRPPFTADDVVIGDVLGDDNRISWKNVRHVCVKRFFDEDFMKRYNSPQCIGYCGE